MKRLMAVVLAVCVAGCSVSATANITIGHPNNPNADRKVVERLVCKGQVPDAESLLLKKGFDDGSIIEAIENAKIKCEKQ